MNDLNRYTVILQVLDNTKSDVSKSYIHKFIYLMQELLSVNFGYDYKLGFCGPYSEKLDFDINTLEDIGLIKVTYDNQRNNYYITITPKGKRTLTRTFSQYKINTDKIFKICKLTQDNNEKYIELLGNIVYLSKFTHNYNELLETMNLIKPRFDKKEIKNIYNKLESGELV